MQHGFLVGGLYRVEPSLNRVTGPNGVTRLEPKVMLVLVCLAERAGEAVPKEHFFQSAWRDTAVTDDVLTRAISELRRLFEDDPRRPRFIETIAKGGYRLIAPVEAPSSTRSNRSWLIVAAVGIAAVAIAAAWLLRSPASSPLPAMRVSSLSAMAGSEVRPAFSPDGRQVAFAWNGEAQDNYDIYVKLVGSSEVRRLTTDPGMDLAPEWSPDGRQIAYVRFQPPFESHARVVSSLGGSDRQVSDFAIWLPAVWSPDGHYLMAGRAAPPADTKSTNGIYLIPLQGGEPRAITQPASPGAHRSPAFSPDGRRLAYASCGESYNYCQLELIDLNAAYGAVGSPRRLTGELSMGRSSITWSRDGRSLVFNADDVHLSYLWRVPADGSRAPERLEIAGANALYPAMAPAGDALAFTRSIYDMDVYRLDLPQSVRAIARSSVFDGNPEFSPDGRRIAFCSLRSGRAMELWVSNADGSGAAQLTHGPNTFQCGPSWSPDGNRVAFESQDADGHPHIWTVDSDGGTPRQVTTGSGDQMDPSWSHDGEWIYFSWSRTNDRDIWRVRVGSDRVERITHGGGFIGHESADGTAVFYIPKFAYSPVLAQPLAGGAPREVIRCVAGTAFSVGAAGIYYVPCSGSAPPDPNPRVRFWNAATARSRDIGTLEKFQYESLPSGFTVSPDGRTILYGRLVRDEADLALIENFR